MSENSAIEWTHHTFTTHWGCSKVSPGCDHCYAERDAARFAKGKTLWGRLDEGAERRYFGDKHWAEPLKWNARAAAAGRRERVFVNSMGDTFDKDVPEDVRTRLWALIEQCPALDWLVLTKRIGNVRRMVPAAWIDEAAWPDHVWIGESAVNQDELERDLPKILMLPARIRFLSLEPLLGPIEIPGLGGDLNFCGACQQFVRMPHAEHAHAVFSVYDLLSWVIVGGESGPQARPMHPEWPRGIRDDCERAGVPFLMKQWGEWAPGIGSRTGFVYLHDGGMRVGGSRTTHEWGDEIISERIGKKAAGRLLDGVQHDGYPT